jgi:hypothetical protein
MAMAGVEPHDFEVRLSDWAEVHELPGDWGSAALRAVLEALEIDGVEESDLLDMTLMGLQDRPVDEAADLVLESLFGSEMSAGVRQNLVDDLQDEQPWQDIADLRHQRRVFTAVTLLQKAFPTRFGKPDILRVEVEIRAGDAIGRKWLAGDIDPALLLRLLAAGMPDRAVLLRLFGSSLAAAAFPEAASIVWHMVRRESEDPEAVGLTVYSSIPWLAPLTDSTSWTARAWPDAPLRQIPASD